MQHISDKRAKLEAELASLQHELNELTNNLKIAEAKINQVRGGLKILSEIEFEQTASTRKRTAEALLQIPAIKLSDAVRKSTVALKRFTLDDVDEWVRSNYPQMDFGRKSIDGAIRRLINDSKVKMLRSNAGNKIPAIYGCIEETSDSETEDRLQMKESARVGI